jgi:hypothetical protein
MGVGSRFYAGISNGDCQTTIAQQRQIGYIVTDAANLILFQAASGQDFPVGSQFVRGTLNYGCDIKLRSPNFNERGDSARDNGGLLAGQAPHLESRAIAHMEELQFDPIVAVDDAAIGQDAVYV